jgi:hypothetical protein
MDGRMGEWMDGWWVDGWVGLDSEWMDGWGSLQKVIQ